jgi:predicted DNA-binding protein with PD1-like motif
MITQIANVNRIVMVRLNPGEDLLHGLQEATKEAGIRNGAILSGAGSLSAYHCHVVETTNLPPGNIFFRDEGAFDILTLTGIINDGRVHAHITFSDDKQAMGGHLEEGTRVLTFAIAAIAELPGVNLQDWDRIVDL